MRIALYPNRGRDHEFEITKRLAQYIEAYGAQAVIEEGVAPDLSCNVPIERASYASCDVMIVLGGDGTFLSAAHLVSARNIPKTGVNLGSVGFLLEAEPDQIEDVVRKLVNKDYRIELRPLLASYHVRSDGVSQDVEFALNDVVLARGNIAKTITIELSIDGETVDHIPGDGIIVATPTGSTAYSLAVGGPILEPSLDAILVSAICPHTLHDRSFVLGADTEIRLALLSEDEEAYLTVDGRASCAVEKGDSVTVRTAPHKLPMIKLWEDAFFKNLPVKIQKRGVSR
ncbi:MAG: NAD(+)/NADH kinase [Clostridiaceae bacterium]|nr:NAD(+)/NADH kinase [Clostridiaceae bacterium]